MSAITLTQLCDEDHNHNFSAERRNSQNRKECWPIRTRKAALRRSAGEKPRHGHLETDLMLEDNA